MYKKDTAALLLIVLIIMLIALAFSRSDIGAKDGVGAGAAWKRPPTVVDTLPDYWGDALEQQADSFGLAYIDIGLADATQYGTGYIIFREQPIPDWGRTKVKMNDRVITRAVVTVSQHYFEPEAHRLNTLCHEMMHALTWVNEVRREGSCLTNGDQPFPGEWDKKFIRKMQKKWG